MFDGISPISSKNRVPPSTDSSSPAFSVAAPVKAPFSCPNSSFASRTSAKLPQFMAKNTASIIGLSDGDIAFGDIDDDGDLDLVAVGDAWDSLNAARAYRNNGYGKFTYYKPAE